MIFFYGLFKRGEKLMKLKVNKQEEGDIKAIYLLKFYPLVLKNIINKVYLIVMLFIGTKNLLDLSDTILP